MKNGYIQLQVQGDYTVAIIVPPENGGEYVDLNTVRNYLDGFKLKGYQIKELNILVSLADPKKELVVGPKPFRPYNEALFITIDSEHMKVYGKFFPPSKGGDFLTEAEIERDLQAHKVINGIMEDAIINQVKQPVYCTEVLLAQGLWPRQGKDSSITYEFDTDLNTRPKTNEDGTVDYHDLNTICSVSKGQLLARLSPADVGESGKDVMGNILKPKSVHKDKLEFGPNIEISDDRLEIISMVDGHASLVNGKVFVFDVYEVNGDVDNSTGDINYNGNVDIKGNVRSGFAVVANGDIIVHGVVEGAKLRASGQIIIKQGVHGMGKAVLDSGSNVISKFIESATVNAKNFISADSILHSKVTAYSNIMVTGRKGFLAGGKICAGSLLEVTNLGTPMGVDTIVEVGVNPELKSKYVDLQKQCSVLEDEMNKIKPIIATFTDKLSKGISIPKKNIEYVQKLVGAYKDIKDQYKTVVVEFGKIQQELEMSQDGEVKVTGKVYPGVQISIAESGLEIKGERNYCRFVQERGEITIKNL